MADNKTGLVITAHPGDFVWRAGGAIALHAKRGYRVKIACLSYGERGESQFVGAHNSSDGMGSRPRDEGGLAREKSCLRPAEELVRGKGQGRP